METTKMEISISSRREMVNRGIRSKIVALQGWKMGQSAPKMKNRLEKNAQQE